MRHFFIAALLFILCNGWNKANAQCTPTNCLTTLPAYGGICDTLLAVGVVNQTYFDFESFHITTSCFDAGIISPANAGTAVKIVKIKSFTFGGLPAGITCAPNQTQYNSPANGCIAVSGTPTQIGVFNDTVKFLADVTGYPLGGGNCTGFAFSQNNNAANYVIRQIIKPNPGFSGLAASYCQTAGPVTLTVTGTPGGIFSGPGVSGNTFNPSVAGPGTHIIKYKVSGQQGLAVAPASDSSQVTVVITPATIWYADTDGDGFGNNAVSQSSCAAISGYVTNGNDCNDNNAAINPNTLWYMDADNDGFGDSFFPTSSCQAPTGYVGNNTDCDDNFAFINPNTIWFADFDNDGYGNPTATIASCTQPAGYTDNNADCNDNDLFQNPNTVWYADTDNDGFGDSLSTVLSCSQPSGFVSTGTDCNDQNAGINPGVLWYVDIDQDGFGNPNVSVSNCYAPVGYVSNNTDCNDQNNLIGGGNTTVYYADFDFDQFYNPEDSIFSCSQPAGYIFLASSFGPDCDDNNFQITKPTQAFYLDNDGDGFGNASSVLFACSLPAGYSALNTDCDDSRADIYPGATEVCDQLDNDCDGQTDENIGTIWYADADGDGSGDASVATQACFQPAGYVPSAGDCDDNNNQLILPTWYEDSDNDGYGNPGISIDSCTAPQGYVSNNTDCNDVNPAINPAAIWYADEDGDQYGNSAQFITACIPPAGYVAQGGDCNDNAPFINPGATEVCNGSDDNCNQLTDEEGGISWYLDADNDGYGTLNNSLVSCVQPTGYVSNELDCNDSLAGVNPLANDIPNNGIDEDCSGSDSTIITAIGTINDSGIQIFPNPGSEQFGIQLDLEEYPSLSVVITNVNGQLVQEWNMEKTNGINLISTRELPNGLFFIIVKTDKGTYSFRWVKE